MLRGTFLDTLGTHQLPPGGAANVRHDLRSYACFLRVHVNTETADTRFARTQLRNICVTAYAAYPGFLALAETIRRPGTRARTRAVVRRAALTSCLVTVMQTWRG